MTENRKIIKKIIFGIELKLVSPLCVSSGQDEVTDSDLQRDFDGKVFVPGTTIAGAMRAYLLDKKELFGFAEELKGKMSSLTVSDMTFEEECTLATSERDGVGLEKKIAKEGAKFSIEIVETGAIAHCHLVLTIREYDPEEEWINNLKEVFFGINEGEIRFGAKKNRGFGQVRIKALYHKEYNRNNVLDWIQYGHNNVSVFIEEKDDLEKWMINTSERYVKLAIPLKLTGGISIRKYATNEEYDFEHIKSGKTSIIPGTSWSGAIRDRMYEIFMCLCKEKDVETESIFRKWFGYVEIDTLDAKRKISRNTAHQSSLIFSESRINEGGTDVCITRNKINRFDNSTIDGALYTEKAHFGGTTQLEVLIRKNECEFTYEALIGLLLLAVEDLQKGYLAVGGQTAVGRGIFEGKLSEIVILKDGEKNLMDKENIRKYIEAFRNYVKEKQNNG